MEGDTLITANGNIRNISQSNFPGRKMRKLLSKKLLIKNSSKT